MSSVPWRMALLGLVAGLVLAVAPVTFWWVGASQTGSSPAPSASPRPSAAPGLVGAPAPAPPVPAEAEPSQPARNQPAPAPPVQLRVPSIAADAPVVPVGVSEHGEMEVPVDVRTVGWYRFGPGPGAAAGSTVLAGHVDDRVQGRGAFFALRELAAGGPVQVELADGSRLEYRVHTVDVVAKEVLPVEQIFQRGGPPRLVLVTCGGDFDRAAREYRENIVVTAEPVG